jgi:hypothetical protein
MDNFAEAKMPFEVGAWKPSDDDIKTSTYGLKIRSRYTSPKKKKIKKKNKKKK